MLYTKHHTLPYTTFLISTTSHIASYIKHHMWGWVAQQTCYNVQWTYFAANNETTKHSFTMSNSLKPQESFGKADYICFNSTLAALLGIMYFTPYLLLHCIFPNTPYNTLKNMFPELKLLELSITVMWQNVYYTFILCNTDSGTQWCYRIFHCFYYIIFLVHWCYWCYSTWVSCWWPIDFLLCAHHQNIISTLLNIISKQ